MPYNIAQKEDVQRVQQCWSKDRSPLNTKLKVFEIRFYTINLHELLSVAKVGLKSFQDLSSKTKAIAHSIHEKSWVFIFENTFWVFVSFFSFA